MKKKIALLGAVLMLGTSLSMFGACKTETAEKKVMNVSLNPEVEFVLDTENKVLSVNALNEEGNLIISAEAFANVKGMEADAAAKLFVQVADETGFLIEGNVAADENKIEISLSGNSGAAKALYDEVKAEVQSYLSESNISATLEQAAAITEAELKALVAECAPYVDTAKMNYSQLINELQKSREETSELYSQELKKAYYEAKSFAFEQAKMEVLKSKLSSIQQLALDALLSVYEDAVATLEDLRYQYLIDENGIYQQALTNFRAKKVEFLNYKNYIAELPESEVTSEQTQRLAAIETALEGVETALLQAGEQADAALNTAKATIQTAYEQIVSQLSAFSVQANAYLSEISAKQTETLTTFTAEFEAKYGEVKAQAETDWKNMQAQLESGYSAE